MMMMMEDTIMIRLSFDEDVVVIPNLSQKSSKEELNQSWFYLQPQLHKAIAHVNAHILHSFQLHNSCPHGIHLYVDGFPLLPNESTGILSISDTISVRKNRNTTSVPLKVNCEGQEEGGGATSKKIKSSPNVHRKNVRGDTTTNQVRKSSQRKVQSSQVKIQKPKVNLKLKKRDDNGKDKLKIPAGRKRSDDIPNNANAALKGTVKTKKQSAEQTRLKSAKDQLNAKRKNEGHEPVPVGVRPGQIGLEPKNEVATPKSRSARRKKMKRQRLQELKRQCQQESMMHKVEEVGKSKHPPQTEGVAHSHMKQPIVLNPYHQQDRGVREKQTSTTNTTSTRRVSKAIKATINQ